MPKARFQILLVALFVSMLGAPAALADASSEAALRAQVESLKQEITRQEALVGELTRKTQDLASTQASSGRAIALAASKLNSSNGSQIAPSSTLAWDRAMKAASAARYMVSGSSLMTVMPTGSMKPLFDERAILVMEPAPYSDLKLGDIVTYTHPKHKMPVVHRITEKRGNSFFTKGDNNSRADEIEITATNYQARVFGIIYAREGGKTE